jgi:DNA-binding response OmpR family regulator
MAHLLIVDDEKNLADALATSLKRADYQVTVVYEGEAALEILQQNPRIDLVLLDVNLGDPVLNGFVLCRRIRKLPQPPLVIMLTIRDSTPDIVDGLECANDYVTKPFAPSILMARIEAALRTRRDAQKTVLSIGDRLQIDTQKRKVYRDETEIPLTTREYDLLRFLAAHPGQPFGRQKLLDEVWGVDYDGLDRTVDRHISALRDKLENDPSDPQYILTVHGFGYQFCEG